MKSNCKSNKHYYISRAGRVHNLLTGNVLEPTIDNKGYLCVDLCQGLAKSNVRQIHRLWAEAWLKVPKHLIGVEDLTVDHIDGDKLNNLLSNYEWMARGRLCYANNDNCK